MSDDPYSPEIPPDPSTSGSTSPARDSDTNDPVEITGDISTIVLNDPDVTIQEYLPCETALSIKLALTGNTPDGLDNKTNKTEMAQINPFATLKYAVEAVPFFDGKNIPIEYFIEGCEMAKSMLTVEAEPFLAKIIRTRLTGEARRATLDQDLATVQGLTNYLRNIFGSSKNIYQLQGELGRIYQKDDEPVITYANRIRDIGKQILEEHRRSNDGTTDRNYKTVLEKDICKCFIRGLRSEIEQRVAKDLDVINTVNDALRVEKELREQKELRREQYAESETCQICYQLGHTAENCQLLTQPATRSNLGKEILICQICKKRGHSADKCRLREGTNQRPVKLTQNNTVVCQICSNSGHYAKNCRLNRNSASINCQLCGKTGHSANGCRSAASNLNSSICQICNKSGHVAKTCSMYKSNNSYNTSNELSCQWCERRGHVASQCWARQRESSSNNPTITCQLCNKIGHKARECRSRQLNNHNSNETGPECRYCKEKGHLIENCTRRFENNQRRQGNFNGPSGTGAERGTGRTGHPVPALPIQSEETITEFI